MSQDAFTKAKSVAVLQGEWHVSDRSDVVFSTVLGSCVAACLYDRIASVGGMNHFLLPGMRDDDGSSGRYGVNAMELLINGLLKKGACRSRIEAKLFGGAAVSGNSANIGASNKNFVTEFLSLEGIPIAGSSLGGSQARRIKFHATSGRAKQAFVTDALVQEKPTRVKAPDPTNAAIELF